MAMAMGSLGLPQITSTPIVPFYNSLNQFHNQPALDGQQFPWQQSQQKQSLWQVVRQNSQHIERPFNLQQKQNNTNNQTTQFPWQLNQFKLNQQQGQNKTNNKDQGDEGNKWDEEWQNKNDTSMVSEDKNEASKASGEQKDGYNSKDEEDDEKDEMEEMQEQFEEWLENTEEKKKQLYKDFQLYLILLLPFLMHEKPIANYFAAAELLSVVLTKLGVNDDDNLVFLLFAQCVDLVALTRGRFKLVEGYKQNWYQEVYDYMLTKLNVHDAIRLGTQMFMPQSPAPEYETR